MQNNLKTKFFNNVIWRVKKLVPRTLYGRFLLITVIPILIIQLVSVYVFYYTHLDVISKHMARGVVEEMSFVKKSINKPDYANLLRDFSQDIDLNFSFEERRRLQKKSKIADSNWRKNKLYKYVNPLIDPYNRFKSELKNHHLTPYEIYQNPENDDMIIVKVQATQGIISFDVPIKRITSSSAYVFTFWIIITALITSLISIIFLRNQVRSIDKLSKIAEQFGRGQDVPNFRPSGSQEIRSLSISFVKMKERVMRQISQRTEMLSSVSHDLRTPLTRMKLQLEMMSSAQEVEDLKQDISDMEKLVEEYLDFARVDNKETNSPVRIKEFLQDKIIKYYAKMHKEIKNSIDLVDDLEMSIKKITLKRALVNLIDNAFNYGNKVSFAASVSNNNLMIIIDDDGPGIPKSERNNVFKPFYRVDNSRNLDKKIASGGSGLGLAIAMDGVAYHGGRIKLSDSPLGGLRVLIYIPI